MNIINRKFEEQLKKIALLDEMQTAIDLEKGSANKIFLVRQMTKNMWLQVEIFKWS